MWYGIGAMTIKLAVTPRTEKVSKVRSSGRVPGVVYGPKQESVSLAIDRKNFEKVMHESGESTIISLEGLDKPLEVLIHDVSFNAGLGGVEHVDFYAIERGKELTTNVPLHFEGEAPAVKLGGSLTKVLHEVEVTCRPSELPSHLTVDVSGLVDFEARVTIADLKLPTGVKVEAGADEVVALVVEVEEEVEEPTTVDMEAVEVEAKGKAEAVEEKTDK